MVKWINKDQIGVSEQVKSISENRAASTKLLKKTAASQIIGPSSSTFNKNRNNTTSVYLSPIFETSCLYFLVTYS